MPNPNERQAEKLIINLRINSHLEFTSDTPVCAQPQSVFDNYSKKGLKVKTYHFSHAYTTPNSPEKMFYE